jgi:hypothetical protein
MKKVISVVLAVVLLVAFTPVMAIAKSPKTEFELNGPHFNLNLVGKADGWNDKEVDNPNRHTMFVPMDTTNWDIDLKQGAGGNKVKGRGTDNISENVTSLPGLQILMTQGTEFAVLDGTAFDGDACELQLGPGKYWVVVAAKAKPVAKQPEIDGWAEIYDNDELTWYYLNLGWVSVKRSWTDATGLFFIDTGEEGFGLPGPTGGSQWIFEYFAGLDARYSDCAYFWQLQNNGSKLIQVRFYPMP